MVLDTYSSTSCGFYCSWRTGALVIASTSLQIKYFSVDPLADMRVRASVYRVLPFFSFNCPNPGYSIVYIPLRTKDIKRYWDNLMSCIENRSCSVVNAERAVQLTGSF